jgi:hypothetical protein
MDRAKFWAIFYKFTWSLCLCAYLDGFESIPFLHFWMQQEVLGRPPIHTRGAGIHGRLQLLVIEDGNGGKQGCQMVYFQTENPYLGILGRALE